MAVLGILGAVGVVVGIVLTLSLGAFVRYSPLPLGALVGAVVGATLGAAFLDWKIILALGLAGALGFGVGFLVGDLLREGFPAVRGLGSIVAAGIIGGAALGGALGAARRLE